MDFKFSVISKNAIRIEIIITYVLIMVFEIEKNSKDKISI